MKWTTATALLLLAALVFVARDDLFRVETMVSDTRLTVDARDQEAVYGQPFELMRTDTLRARLRAGGEVWAHVTLIDMKTNQAREAILEADARSAAEAIFADVPPGTFQLHVTSRHLPQLPVQRGPVSTTPASGSVEAAVEIYDGAARPWRFAFAAGLLLVPLLLASSRDD